MKGWKNTELTTLAVSYFTLRYAQQNGLKANKSAFRRFTLNIINTIDGGDHRSEASYEMKMQNLTAACESVGIETVAGYKARGAYQKALVEYAKDFTNMSDNICIKILAAVDKFETARKAK